MGPIPDSGAANEPKKSAEGDALQAQFDDIAASLRRRQQQVAESAQTGGEFAHPPTIEGAAVRQRGQRVADEEIDFAALDPDTILNESKPKIPLTLDTDEYAPFDARVRELAEDGTEESLRGVLQRQRDEIHGMFRELGFDPQHTEEALVEEGLVPDPGFATDPLAEEGSVTVSEPGKEPLIVGRSLKKEFADLFKGATGSVKQLLDGAQQEMEKRLKRLKELEGDDS